MMANARGRTSYLEGISDDERGSSADDPGSEPDDDDVERALKEDKLLEAHGDDRVMRRVGAGLGLVSLGAALTSMWASTKFVCSPTLNETMDALDYCFDPPYLRGAGAAYGFAGVSGAAFGAGAVWKLYMDEREHLAPALGLGLMGLGVSAGMYGGLTARRAYLIWERADPNDKKVIRHSVASARNASMALAASAYLFTVSLSVLITDAVVRGIMAREKKSGKKRLRKSMPRNRPVVSSAASTRP